MKKAVLCSYHYDPLDRLTGTTPALQSGSLRFHCQSRIATEIQGDTQHSIMQHGDQLLAQQTRQADKHISTLLVTDSQRSVLHTVNDEEQRSIAYSPFGHTMATHTHPLLNFNGERCEPTTGHYLLGNGYRAFNPVLMRFNSPDSWGPFSTSGINTYAYCMNRPVNSGDPSGHISLFIGTQLLRWSRRAQARLVETTGFIYLSQNRHPISRAALNPGITSVAAVTARARMYKELDLGNVVNFKQKKHSENIIAASRRYLSLKESAGQRLITHPNIHEELPNQMHYLVAPRPAHEDVNFLKNIETNSSGLPRQTANTINLPTTNYLRKLNLEAEQHWAKHDAKHEQIRRDHFTYVLP